MAKLDNLLFNKSETSVMTAFADYDYTKAMKSRAEERATKIKSLPSVLMRSGDALGKWLEWQYILHLREMLDVLDLFDPYYEKY